MADYPQGEEYNPDSANQYYIDMEAMILACFWNEKQTNMILLYTK